MSRSTIMLCVYCLSSAPVLLVYYSDYRGLGIVHGVCNYMVPAFALPTILTPTLQTTQNHRSSLARYIACHTRKCFAHDLLRVHLVLISNTSRDRRAWRPKVPLNPFRSELRMVSNTILPFTCVSARRLMSLSARVDSYLLHCL